MLIKPTPITIKDMDGVERNFNISRVPAVHGRKIFTQYATTVMPKIGNYEVNQDLMLLMLSYVEAQMPNGDFIQLRTQSLIDSHVGDWETLGRLELEMVKYNTNFFHPEKISSALAKLNQTLPEKILSTLTRYLDVLSVKSKPRSKS